MSEKNSIERKKLIDDVFNQRERHLLRRSIDELIRHRKPDQRIPSIKSEIEDLYQLREIIDP